MFCMLISPHHQGGFGYLERIGIKAKNLLYHACNKEGVISDTYASDLKSLNSRSVLGMQEIGRGQASLEYFYGMMDMLPPLGVATYSAHVNRLARVSMDSALENMRAASAHLHKLQGIFPDKVINAVLP